MNSLVRSTMAIRCVTRDFLHRPNLTSEAPFARILSAICNSASLRALPARERPLSLRRSRRGVQSSPDTASGQARQGFIYTPHYAASKFGVVGITQSLAKEVAKEGITVNAICPGIIDTDMWAYNDRAWGKLLGNYGPRELMAEWVRGIPMGRAGTGKDVAGLVAFLAGADADYITGQTINVDGGLIMS
jgi:meso-butanediol dehydrogenase/(S,S)-butanediol dehydrogenase/diacetyl reductase